MAILTIPTSIGGLNLPSISFGGPLGSLYQRDGLDFVQYPRDLGSATKAHTVQFTIEEVQETSFADVQNTGKNLMAGSSNLTSKDVAESVGAATSSAVSFLTGGFGEAIDSTSSAIGNVTRAISERKGKPVGYIALYMPDNFNITSNMSYDDSTTIASAAGALPLIGSAVSKLTSGIQNDAARLALNKAGYVFNPQKQMLFQGIEFRQFNMTFTFTPYSQREAEDVNKIIKMFRKWSAPRASTAAAGMFWIPPALFNVEFQFQGKINDKLPRLEKCVVESVDVNYAPNGWTTHSDGAPIQTVMTIQLQEIVLIDRDKIENGF